MIVYTIGFGRKNAEQFFSLLKRNQISLLVDIRLNNRSQLAGYTKDGDIQYFLKEICGIEYTHDLDFAPTKELLSGYQAKEIPWSEYVETYTKIIRERGTYKQFVDKYSEHERVCLLCSEPKPDMCHRRILAEMIAEEAGDAVQIVHL